MLQSCNAGGCADSAPVAVSGTLAGAIGYFKASNTGGSDEFDYAISLSADGDTLAVGAPGEASNATGINGDRMSNGLTNSGAAYLY